MAFVTYRIFKNSINNKLKITTDDTIINGYSEITHTATLTDWINACDMTNRDFKFKRRILKQFGDVDDTTWDSYNQNTKFILCSHRATLLERCRVVLGEDLYYWMSRFDAQSYESRRIRINMAKSLLLSNVEQITAFVLKQIMDNDKLIDSYVNDGVEGTLEGDVTEGLFNFMISTPLSTYGGETHDPTGAPLGRYEFTGLATHPMVFMLPNSNLTKQQLIDKIYDCLKYGIY